MEETKSDELCDEQQYINTAIGKRMKIEHLDTEISNNSSDSLNLKSSVTNDTNSNPKIKSNKNVKSKNSKKKVKSKKGKKSLVKKWIRPSTKKRRKTTNKKEIESPTIEKEIEPPIIEREIESPTNEREEEPAIPSREPIPNFLCVKCNMNFKTKNDVDEHISSMHINFPIEPLIKKTFECGTCQITFLAVDIFRAHFCNALSNESAILFASYCCTVENCEKDFVIYNSYLKHMRVVHKVPVKDEKHTKNNIVMYQCKSCFKLFISEFELDYHNKKPCASSMQMCNICQYICQGPSILSRHINEKHKDVPYVTEILQKPVPVQGELTSSCDVTSSGKSNVNLTGKTSHVTSQQLSEPTLVPVVKQNKKPSSSSLNLPISNDPNHFTIEFLTSDNNFLEEEPHSLQNYSNESSKNEKETRSQQNYSSNASEKEKETSQQKCSSNSSENKKETHSHQTSSDSEKECHDLQNYSIEVQVSEKYSSKNPIKIVDNLFTSSTQISSVDLDHPYCKKVHIVKVSDIENKSEKNIETNSALIIIKAPEFISLPSINNSIENNDVIENTEIILKKEKSETVEIPSVTIELNSYLFEPETVPEISENNSEIQSSVENIKQEKYSESSDTLDNDLSADSNAKVVYVYCCPVDNCNVTATTAEDIKLHCKTCHRVQYL